MKQNERDVILWLSTWKVWCGVLCGSLNWSEKQLLFEAYNGTPLQYPCLENPMDGGAWLAAVHGVAKSRTRLSHFIFTFHFHALEKEMATHSSVLAWRIPGTGEPGELLSMGSHRVGHDWSDLAAAAACRRSCKGPISAMNWSDREVGSSQISKASEGPVSRVISLVLIV